MIRREGEGEIFPSAALLLSSLSQRLVSSGNSEQLITDHVGSNNLHLGQLNRAINRRCAFWLIPFVLIIGVMLVPTAMAHFKLNLNIRIVHVEHLPEGLDVYLRLPMPYLVANLLGPEKTDGSRKPAPFTTNALVDGELMHYVDSSTVESDPLSLGQLAADGHKLAHEGNALAAVVVAVRLFTGNDQPPFSTLEEAKDVFRKPAGRLTDPPPFVGDTIVDVQLRYRVGKPIKTYAISSVLNPGLPGQEDTANLILDHDGTDQRIFRVSGLLLDPQQVSRSEWDAAVTFIDEGVRHILGGYDHLMYVACLVIGAASLGGLAWRITGFTIGHSVTLSLGYFGFVPSGDWFIAAVETGIALSIIYAAILALSVSNRAHKGRNSFLVTAAIGLLHGLGFSFVLREILGMTSANIWVSLLSFNVGVELGQLVVVVVLWPVLWLIAKASSRWHNVAKWIIAVPAIALASMWTGERTIRLLAAL